MKMFVKVLSMALVATLLLATPLVAMAAPISPGTITIDASGSPTGVATITTAGFPSSTGAQGFKLEYAVVDSTGVVKVPVAQVISATFTDATMSNASGPFTDISVVTFAAPAATATSQTYTVFATLTDIDDTTATLVGSGPFTIDAASTVPVNPAPPTGGTPQIGSVAGDFGSGATGQPGMSYKVLIDGMAADDYELPMTAGASLTIDAPAKSIGNISYVPAMPKVSKWAEKSGMLGVDSVKLEKDVDYKIDTKDGKPTISFSDSFMENLPAGKHELCISFFGKLVKITIVK